jgi:hypothetical protein
VALERRYRRLLRCYPPSHRAAHREEMLGVLLAAARPGQRRPGARQAVNLVACGLAIRARRFLTAGRWQDALAVVSLIGPVLALALAALNVAVAVRQEVALDHGWRPAVPFWRAALVPDLGGPAVVMFGGSVSSLLYVLGIVLAIAVSRVGGTVGRRVAALVTAGFLPGLVNIVTLPVASGQTPFMVFWLGGLVVTVLVWPLAIVSWKVPQRMKPLS